MLVLSRKLNEKIVFPGSNASVHVVSVKGNVVRLGVEAPPEVTVLRGELVSQSAGDKPPARPRVDEERFARLAHQINERLRTTGAGLGTVQLLLDVGLTDEAKETLALLTDDFRLIRLGLEGELEGTAPTPPSARRSSPGRVARRSKALVVEDDQNQRELLAGLLRLNGLDVDTANDGCDALDYLRGSRPDVVLLDMGLPRCDGATTVRTIRRDPSYAGMRHLRRHRPVAEGLRPRPLPRRHRPLDPEAARPGLPSARPGARAGPCALQRVRNGETRGERPVGAGWWKFPPAGSHRPFAIPAASIALPGRPSNPSSKFPAGGPGRRS